MRYQNLQEHMFHRQCIKLKDMIKMDILLKGIILGFTVFTILNILLINILPKSLKSGSPIFSMIGILIIGLIFAKNKRLWNWISKSK